MPLSLDAFRFAGLSLGGEFEYLAESRWSSAGESSRRDAFRVSLRPAARGYYWQPWFARWYASANLDLTLANPLFGDAENDDLSGLGVTLGTDLFPESRFPFTLSFTHDETHRDDLLLSGERSARTRLGLNGSYRRKPGERYSGLLAYTHTERGVGDRQTDSIDLALNADYELSKQQNLTADFRWNLAYDRAADSAHEDMDTVLLLTHHFEPDPSLFTDSTFNYTRSEFTDDAGAANQLGIAQLSSFLSWRPEDPRWLVTSNALLNRTENTASGGSTNLDHFALLNASASFRYSPTTDFHGNLSNFYTERTDSYRGTQSLRANYRRPGTEWRGFQYDWTAGAGAQNTFATGADSGDDGYEVDGELAHTLQRALAWRGLTNLARHAAQVRAAAGSLDGTQFELDLRHTWNTGWVQSLAQATVSASVTLEDRRLLRPVEGDDPAAQGNEDEQRFTLSAAARRALSSTEELTASLYMNAHWRHADDDGTGASEDAATRSSLVTLGYANRALFNRPRLRFTSVLTSRHDSQLGIGIGSGEDDEVRWENDLEYLIGRLEIALDADLLRRNGQGDGRVFLRLTRRFGR